jgi:fructokinase
LPRFVSAGEALTDFIRLDTERWLARTGGAPWNVARAMRALGVASGFAGSVSQDVFGDELLKASRDAGLDMRFTQQVAKPPLLAMVHETAPPQYFFVGTDSADLAFDPTKLPTGWLNAVEWLHVGSISLTREPLRRTLLDLIDAVKRQGKRVSFDPNYRILMKQGYADTLRYVAERADLIKVSDEDLHGLFGTTDVAAGLAQMRAINAAAPILLTRGAAGAELHVGTTVLRRAPPRIDVIDSVGAGDASAAGFLFSLMTHARDDWRTHLDYAVCSGAAACLHRGAVPPTLAAVDALRVQSI